MANENRVQLNLKNVHYAVLTESTTGGTTSYSWDTPVPVPGAVNLNLEQQGEITKFYADGIVYYQSPVNNGYEGDLEMARIIDKMLQDVWGMTLGTTSKVLTENANTEAKAFALLFQIDGDAGEDCYVFYNCTATRPAVAAKTKEDTKEPQTQSITISAAPLGDGRIVARTTSESPTATKSGWFSQVFTEGNA